MKGDEGFNPLEIGSSVLIRWGSMGGMGDIGFQSPRNRVKCSDPPVLSLTCRAPSSFNPLEIGSSVLIDDATYV